VATPTLACAPGSPSSPIPGAAGTWEWSAISYINTAVLGVISPYLDLIAHVFAPQLFSVDALCATPPEVPPVFVNGDWGSAIGDFLNTSFPNPAFMVKLNQYVQYGMFERFCQCGASGPPVTPPSGGITVPANPTGQWNHSLNGIAISSYTMVCPIPPTGTNQQFEFTVGWTSVTGQTADTTGACGMAVYFIPAGTTAAPAQPYVINQTPITACNLANFRQVNVVLPYSATQQWEVGLWQTSQTASVVNGFYLTPSCAPLSPTTPTLTIPVKPTSPCDATTLCDLTWIIWNTQQTQYAITANNQSTTNNIAIGITPVTVGSPSYTDGATHSISGSGSAATALATRALRVQLTGWPIPLDPRPTVPPDFYNVGWVVTGSGQQWDRRTWIRRTPQFVQPLNQPLTQFSWGLADQVTATVTELL
jgi:hypothetical protein